jgi:hypothetical protein
MGGREGTEGSVEGIGIGCGCAGIWEWLGEGVTESIG